MTPDDLPSNPGASAAAGSAVPAPMSPDEKVDFGILTIREDELRAVLAQLPEGARTVVSRRRRYRVHRLQLSETEAYTIAVVRCEEQGNGAAQAAARDLLDDLAPQWLLVVGIAGGVPSDELSLGDVVVSTRVVDFSVEAVLRDHEREYALGGGPLHPEAARLVADISAMVEAGELGDWNDVARIRKHLPPVELLDEAFYGDETWRKDLRASLEHRFRAPHPRPPRVTTGTVASSDRLIKDTEILRHLLKFARQVRAVEMEAAGVFRAAHDRQVPFLTIRGISDLVGFKRHRDWTEYACHTAASLMRALLLTRPITPRSSAAAAEPKEGAPEAHVGLSRMAPVPLPLVGPVVGREPLTAKLTEELLRESPRPVVVLGPAGIGKSTVTLEAAHRAEVCARYGSRRWFVRLDAAPTMLAAMAHISATIGITISADPLSRIRTALARDRSLLILDNLETPWEGDPVATEGMLAELAATPQLALVVSMRGAQSPGGIYWGDRRLEVPQLTPSLAGEMFTALAPEHRDRAGQLASLLAPLGGVPLAIALLARAAEGNDLENLMNEWQRHKTGSLSPRSTPQDRLSSWAVSVELSIASRRMTPAARRLITVLASLPDGIAVNDLDLVLADGSKAARVLSQVGLAYFEGGRLQMLAPIREHVQQEHRPEHADLDRAMEHYGELAHSLGPKCGTLEGAAAAARLVPEVSNLDAMIRRGLERSDALRWVDTALALAGFSYLSGRSTPSPLEAALGVAARTGAVSKEARCTVRLGDLAVRRADHGLARERYERALDLYRQDRDLIGEAGCIRRFGDLAQQQASLAEGRARYEQARELSIEAGDQRGQAHCLKGLGRVALQRGDRAQARAIYHEALPLFRSVRDALGEHGSLRRLGDLALDADDLQEAFSRYEEARRLCRVVADALGEAKCARGLGEVARRLGNTEEARARYGEAIRLFQQVSDASGEAECARALEGLNPSADRGHQ